MTITPISVCTLDDDNSLSQFFHNSTMGNCMHGNSIANPTPVPKKIIAVSRKSKRNSAEIPTYPSIEDVINNNRRRRLIEYK
jgi:hypothetical protein